MPEKDIPEFENAEMKARYEQMLKQEEEWRKGVKYDKNGNPYIVVRIEKNEEK